METMLREMGQGIFDFVEPASSEAVDTANGIVDRVDQLARMLGGAGRIDRDAVNHSRQLRQALAAEGSQQSLPIGAPSAVRTALTPVLESDRGAAPTELAARRSADRTKDEQINDAQDRDAEARDPERTESGA